MQILLNNRQRRHRIATRQLKRAAERILNDLGCPDETELSVTIVGDRTIRQINRDYLDRDRPTNVISFSLQEGECGIVRNHALGDVIISADTAAREAAAGGITMAERIVFLLLHGTLHLCGYDHERSGEEEARRMEAREKKLFRILTKEGLSNPAAS